MRLMESGTQVLIVDDQEGIRKLLAEACAMMGYRAVTAASGTEALQIIAKDNFAVAFIDMKMPGLNGLDTLQQLHKIRPDLKSFLMTGYGETYLMEDALQSGAEGVILKPFDLDEIKELLQSI